MKHPQSPFWKNFYIFFDSIKLRLFYTTQNNKYFQFEKEKHLLVERTNKVDFFFACATEHAKYHFFCVACLPLDQWNMERKENGREFLFCCCCLDIKKWNSFCSQIAICFYQHNKQFFFEGLNSFFFFSFFGIFFSLSFFTRKEKLYF